MNATPSIIRTATVTWITYENYGTYLQAYALQQVITSLGYDNHILDDWRIVRPGRVRQWISRMKRAVLKTGMPENVRKAFHQFKATHLSIDDEWKSLNEVSANYDIFLCGSDQIWSTHIPITPYYFLNFTQKKKIAYAPSLGTDRIPETYSQTVRPLLADFAAISVREESGAIALTQALGKEVQAVLDPTLLLTAEQWNHAAASTPQARGDYLPCYFLTPNRWYMDYAAQYAARHRLTLKVFALKPEYRYYGDEQLYVGPGEFLTLVRSAHTVFTDSFHASIFSLIYGKDFVTFKRFDDQDAGSQNSRIVDLFNKLDLRDRLVGKDCLDRVETLQPIVHTHVQEKLQPLRNASLSFLKKALQQ